MRRLPFLDAPVAPLALAALAVALFCIMDAMMKELTLALGSYDAVLWRTLMTVPISGGLYALSRPVWPNHRTFQLHCVRGVTSAAMALSSCAPGLVLEGVRLRQ